jgi:hypothetical protein
MSRGAERILTSHVGSLPRPPGDVAAGADCCSSQACHHTEVHPKIIWAKFRALSEGAWLASKAL